VQSSERARRFRPTDDERAGLTKGKSMPLGYLDGNTGSLIATALVGGTAGAVVAMKSARARVSEAFSRKRKGGDVVDAPAQAEAQAPVDSASPDTAPPPGT
jgi:hypothetical protein